MININHTAYVFQIYNLKPNSTYLIAVLLRTSSYGQTNKIYVTTKSDKSLKNELTENKN